MTEWRQVLIRRFGHWLTPRKRTLPAIGIVGTRLPGTQRDWSIRETIIDMSRDIRTRNPLSTATIISGALPSRIIRNDGMSYDLLSNYEPSVFMSANRKMRRNISWCRTRFVVAAIFGSAMLKVLRSLRAKTSTIPSIQLSLSAWLRFIFDASSACQEFEKYYHVFFLSHNIYHRKWTRLVLLDGAKIKARR